MKTIYIVRHAKSSWDNPSLTDHDRPLADTGIAKTKLIVEYLLKKNVRPELMISSSAVRARETAKLMAAGLGYPVDKIRIEDKLYHASPDSIADEMYALADNINSVMIFGHNPTLTYFVNQYLEPSIENLPTSGVVAIEFNTEMWNQIASAKNFIRFTIFPKMIR